MRKISSNGKEQVKMLAQGSLSPRSFQYNWEDDIYKHEKDAWDKGTKGVEKVGIARYVWPGN